MKKLLTALLAALCVVCVAPFAACDSETETITLTTDNYDKYILLSADIGDMDVEYISEDNYFISCTYSITASTKGDFSFKNVELSAYCENTSEKWSWTNMSSTTTSNGYFASILTRQTLTFELDFYGNGQASARLYKSSASSPAFVFSSCDLSITVSSISGTVAI